MQFLDLVRRLRSECGIAGSGPTTVVGQTGEMRRLVDWIAQAYDELQMSRPDWEWMRKTKTFNTTASKQSYHPTNAAPDIALTDFSQWRNDSFRIYLTSAGKNSEIILTHEHDYNGFRDYYLLGARTTTYGQPIAISIGPDKSLVFGLGPNGIYTATAEYYSTPQQLALDADIPLMPARFHMIIVYAAMKKYGMYESAVEQVQQGQSEYNKLHFQLEIDQAPPILWGASLIS